MTDLKLALTIRKNFPATITGQLELLPEEAQKEFLYRFSSQKKSVGLGYISHFFLGSSYAYQEKWMKQILFWLTGFGFGIGWVINLFRMPSMINKLNEKNAYKLLQDISNRYLRAANPQQAPKNLSDFIRKNNVPKSVLEIKPREIRPETDDPVHLSVENMTEGYMLDFNLQTWNVINEHQFDWDNGYSERVFLLSNGSMEQTYVNLRYESGHTNIMNLELKNIHVIDPNMQIEILRAGQPRNVIHYQGNSYYRENPKKGFWFSISETGAPKKVRTWEYFDQDRQYLIRVEFYDGNDFRAFTGRYVSALDFSEILPK